MADSTLNKEDVLLNGGDNIHNLSDELVFQIVKKSKNNKWIFLDGFSLRET